ncbi:MAG: SPOR domain-containing protein [Tannerella sp.]|jgi:cell division protein FtsN|nr:SPOR domain-containing protein [Tannerella sp.]
MKKFFLFSTVICFLFAFNSCKSKSSAYKTAYEQARSADVEYETDVATDDDDDDSEVLTSEEISYESVRQESVRPMNGEDVSGLKRYSVVIGSFKNRTNAYSLKERMIEEGYRPVVAENDFGMLRVIVSSFDSKADAARSRDSIKKKYAPNFQDAWLLERKY